MFGPKLSAFISLLFSFVFFFLAYKGYRYQSIDLNTCDTIRSVIVGKGIAMRKAGKAKSKSFYIQLADADKKLGVYRKNKNYRDLLAKFNVGDTVVAYYINHKSSSENINIDLVQVDKNGQVILDKKEFEEKESSLIYIGLLGGLFTLLASYMQYRGIFHKRQRIK